LLSLKEKNAARVKLKNALKNQLAAKTRKTAKKHAAKTKLTRKKKLQSQNLKQYFELQNERAGPWVSSFHVKPPLIVVIAGAGCCNRYSSFANIEAGNL